MILIDSSVWIDYFNGGENSVLLGDLINLDLAVTNDVILTELIPNLRFLKKNDFISAFEVIENKRLNIFWDGIRELRILNLKNGINKVGIADLIIAQQCLDQNLELWSFDKHFKLMAQHTNLKLFTA